MMGRLLQCMHRIPQRLQFACSLFYLFFCYGKTRFEMAPANCFLVHNRFNSGFLETAPLAQAINVLIRKIDGRQEEIPLPAVDL